MSESLWDELAAAHDEVINAVAEALNLTTGILTGEAGAASNDNTSFSSILTNMIWGNSTSGSSSSPSVLSEFFTGATKNLSSFKNAINWREPFFIGMLLLHALVASGTVAAIRRGAGVSGDDTGYFFIGWMCALFALIALSTGLNSLGSQYSSLLFPKGGANYFDESGLFISVIWSLPLLIQLIVMLLVLVASTAKMFAVTKIKKAQYERFQQQQQNGNNNNNNAGGKKKQIENKKKK